VQPGAQFARQLPDVAGICRGLFQQAELDGERDELLLGAVVQVPLDALPFGVQCLYQPGGATPADRRWWPAARR
jgi:hypothetical protein